MEVVSVFAFSVVKVFEGADTSAFAVFVAGLCDSSIFFTGAGIGCETAGVEE